MSRSRDQRGSLRKGFTKREGWVWYGRWRVYEGRKSHERCVKLGPLSALNEAQARIKLQDAVDAAAVASHDMRTVGYRSFMRHRIHLSPANGNNHSRGARGAMAELLVCADLLGKGLEVYRAADPQGPCDLIVVDGQRAIRVEVKLVSAGGWVDIRRHAGKFDVLAKVDREGVVEYQSVESSSRVRWSEIDSEKFQKSSKEFGGLTA